MTESDNGTKAKLRRVERIIVTYKCLVCGKIWETEKQAIDCEKITVEEAICKVGDAVMIDGNAVIIDEISIDQETHKLSYCYFDGHRHYYTAKDGIRVNK